MKPNVMLNNWQILYYNMYVNRIIFKLSVHGKRFRKLNSRYNVFFFLK